MKFSNRDEAANLLLKKLDHYKNTHPLVLGIPRGAVPMAKVIAEGLKAELGAILVHKIPAPYNEEFAIGSIGLSGRIQLMPYAESMGISDAYLKEAAQQQLKILKMRQINYGIKEPNYKDRIVIIVDDGIATGATTLSAIQEVLLHKPQKIIVATAVASEDSAAKIRAAVDEFIALLEPSDFYAVGQFFVNFPQVSDEEVITCLKPSNHSPNSNLQNP